jgi:antirestriction protein ArdC
MNSIVYQKITDIIIEKLEQGIVPWHRPWNSFGEPINLVTKRPYRGINVFLLLCLGYELPYFLTFKQAKKLGGTIKKGEKSNLVVFYKWLEAKDDKGNVVIQDDGTPKVVPMLRYYHIFNIEQCAYLDPQHIPEVEEREFRPIEKAEQIIRGMPNKPEVQFKRRQACYIPEKDLVEMPGKTSFKSDEELYSTMFHELTHATGHQSRLNRPGITDTAKFGSANYSKEELIAEMGATFLCSEAGIANAIMDNSVAYISNWLSKLRNDKRLVLIAAGAAQKACDYILNKQFNSGENHAN